MSEINRVPDESNKYIEKDGDVLEQKYSSTSCVITVPLEDEEEEEDVLESVDTTQSNYDDGHVTIGQNEPPQLRTKKKVLNDVDTFLVQEITILPNFAVQGIACDSLMRITLCAKIQANPDEDENPMLEYYTRFKDVLGEKLGEWEYKETELLLGKRRKTRNIHLAVLRAIENCKGSSLIWIKYRQDVDDQVDLSNTDDEQFKDDTQMQGLPGFPKWEQQLLVANCKSGVIYHETELPGDAFWSWSHFDRSENLIWIPINQRAQPVQRFHYPELTRAPEWSHPKVVYAEHLETSTKRIAVYCRPYIFVISKKNPAQFGFITGVGGNGPGGMIFGEHGWLHIVGNRDKSGKVIVMGKQYSQKRKLNKKCPRLMLESDRKYMMFLTPGSDNGTDRSFVREVRMRKHGGASDVIIYPLRALFWLLRSEKESTEDYLGRVFVMDINRDEYYKTLTIKEMLEQQNLRSGTSEKRLRDFIDSPKQKTPEPEEMIEGEPQPGDTKSANKARTRRTPERFPDAHTGSIESSAQTIRRPNGELETMNFTMDDDLNIGSTKFGGEDSFLKPPAPAALKPPTPALVGALKEIEAKVAQEEAEENKAMEAEDEVIVNLPDNKKTKPTPETVPNISESKKPEPEIPDKIVDVVPDIPEIPDVEHQVVESSKEVEVTEDTHMSVKTPSINVNSQPASNYQKLASVVQQQQSLASIKSSHGSKRSKSSHHSGSHHSRHSSRRSHSSRKSKSSKHSAQPSKASTKHSSKRSKSSDRSSKRSNKSSKRSAQPSKASTKHSSKRSKSSDRSSKRSKSSDRSSKRSKSSKRSAQQHSSKRSKSSDRSSSRSKSSTRKSKPTTASSKKSKVSTASKKPVGNKKGRNSRTSKSRSSSQRTTSTSGSSRSRSRSGSKSRSKSLTKPTANRRRSNSKTRSKSR